MKLRLTRQAKYPALEKKNPLEYADTTACVGGTWFAFESDDGRGGLYGWSAGKLKLVAKHFNENMIDGVLDASGTILVVDQEGVIARLEKTKLEIIRKRSRVYGQRHNGVAIGWDPVRSAVVAFGGDVKFKRSSDTLVYTDGDWTKLEPPSPAPKDRAKGKHFGRFALVFDTTLGCMLRFGPTSLARLDGDVWTTLDVKGYLQLGKVPRSKQDWLPFLPMHDPSTGETLLYNFATDALVRFDLGGCVKIATIEGSLMKREHGSADYMMVFEQVGEGTKRAFDARTRTLVVQGREHADLYSVALGPAFDHAKKLRPRTRV